VHARAREIVNTRESAFERPLVSGHGTAQERV